MILCCDKKQLFGLPVSVLDVHLQVLFAREALLAVRTLKWLNSSMEPQMSLKISRFIKGLHAAPYLTLKNQSLF